jgi:hypothetical protein
VKTAAPPAGIAPVVGQLREIGRVKAKTFFCSALVSGAVPAARSSIAYEALLYRTAEDFGVLKVDDPLRRRKSLDLLEKDVRTLGILSTEGRKELATLKDLDAPAPPGAAKSAVALRDALDGAKVRQYELAKSLATVIARLEGRKTHSIIDLPLDNLDPTLQYLSIDFLETGNDEIVSEASRAATDAIPQNDDILRDLKTAATHATEALKAGGC